MKWSFAVPAGPAETFRERAKEAAINALAELDPAAAEDLTIDAIEAAIDRVAGEGVPEADSATVTVET